MCTGPEEGSNLFNIEREARVWLEAERQRFFAYGDDRLAWCQSRFALREHLIAPKISREFGSGDDVFHSNETSLPPLKLRDLAKSRKFCNVRDHWPRTLRQGFTATAISFRRTKGSAQGGSYE